jgi:small subunit ribosomal protein S7
LCQFGNSRILRHDLCKSRFCEKKIKRNALEIFKEALNNITPRIEVRSRRIGGATYQIPVEVSDRRGSALALKWLKTAIEKASGRNLSEKIFSSMMESLENKGWAVKKREEVFRVRTRE